MIKGLLVWQNPDSTRDLNSAWGLVAKGIYDGGALTLSASNLGVTVAPFLAKSKDGMTVVSDAPETLMLTAGTTQYLVLFAKYEAGAPVLQLQLVSSATWTTSVNKDYFITLARFITPALATFATSSVVRYEDGEYRDKVGLTPWRNAVANIASLPTTGNRSGDLRITLDTFDVYTWNGTTQTWDALGMGTDLTAISSRRTVDTQAERLALSTSGILGSVLDSQITHVSDITHQGISFSLVEQGVPNQLGIGALHSYVHGHFIQNQSQVVTLPTAPGVGTRYDLLFLEVWQEVIPTALGVPYLSSSATSDPLATVVNFLNTCQESNTTNYRVEAIEFIDPTTVVITKSAFRTTSGVLDGTIADPSVGMTASNNQFGNPYTNIAGGDRFAFRASAPSVFSQTTWAIPLLVLRRTSTEGNFNVFDGTTRCAFDVAPRATIGRGLSEALTWLTSYGFNAESVSKPSGFFVDVERTPLVINSIGSGYVRLPTCKLRVKGHTLKMYDVDVRVPVADATGGRRDLVYIELLCSSSPESLSSTYFGFLGGDHIDARNFNGNRQYSWYGRVRASSVGVATDEADSLTALGFLQTADDPALWSRPATAEENTKDGYVYAFAVAIIHRRNSGVWNISTNPNGSGSRPDYTLTDTYLIHDREWVDLRRTIVTRADVSSIVSKSFDRVVTGRLRTRLRQHPYAADVYGTSAMITTLTSAAPSAGRHTMTPVPSASNAHTSWSDSDELECLSFRIQNLTVAQASADGVFSWDGGGDTGILTVAAPTGMHFHRESMSITGPVSAQYYAYQISAPYDRCFAFEIDSAGGMRDAPYYTTATVNVTTTDYASRPTGFTATSTDWVASAPATASLVFVVWAIKRNKDVHSSYSTNGCLFGSPTLVYGATHGGTPIHVGPITARVTMPVTGSTITVTQANVFTVRGDIASAAGAINMYGVASIRASGAAIQPRYVKLQNAGGTTFGLNRMQIELQTPLPANTPVELIVMCDGDVHYRWIEVVPESRQVRGLYSYAYGSAAYNSSYSQAGYFGLWRDRNNVSAATQRGVPFSETSLAPMYGVTCGQAVPGNLWPLKPDQAPDFMMASVMASAGNGYVFWFDSSDLGTVNQTSPLFIGIKGDYGKGAAATNGFTWYGTHASHSPHIPGFTLGQSQNVAHNDIACVGVIKVAPTAALELTYEVPTYQGSVSASELRTKLRGELAHVSDVLVTTEGSNASVLHPAICTLPPVHWKEAGPSTGLAVAASQYRNPRNIPIDIFDTGTVVSDVQLRSRSRVSMTRQIPYPAPPTTTSYERYVPATALRHSAIDRRPYTRVVSRMASAVDVAYYHMWDYSGVAATNMYSDSGTSLNLGTTNPQVMWVFQIPPGAKLLRVAVHVGNTTGGTVNGSAELRLSERSTSNGFYSVIGTAVISAPNNTMRFYTIGGADTAHNKIGYNYQAANTEARFAVRVIMPGDVSVSAVEYSYMEYIDDVLGHSASHNAVTYPTLGLERIAESERSRSPRSTLLVPPAQMGVQGIVGTVIDIPAGWAPVTDTNMTASVFVSGASDSTGDWPRGATAMLDDNASYTYYESGLFGYVPFSGCVLYDIDRMGKNGSNPDLTVPMPVRTPQHDFKVAMASSGINIHEVLGVATVTPYGMINASKELTLGISTGVMNNSMNLAPQDTFDSNPSVPRSNIYSLQAGGSTIDAFYPVGRPVVETA